MIHRCFFATLLILLAALPVSASDIAAVSGYRALGTVLPRHAREIQGSNWSVGAETMDRDYTVYKAWREYLGPLGIKRARIQAGWAKTEKTPGHYDWAWLDEIILDMPKQGVKPWVCLSYGNPLYQASPDAKLANLGSNPSTDPKVMQPWLRFVAAFVERYKGVVDEWELWNEPRGGAKIAADYARFMIATAQAIRARQPKAVIIGFAAGGIDLGLIKGGLDVLKQEGKLGLLDFVSYHPYEINPDRSYPKVGQLRRLINSYDKRIRILQGENGAPSEKGGFGAITDYDWNEERQAKWALRRLLGDLGRDIPSSYFAICDMLYPNRVNHKGLLAVNPDKTVNHVKQAYGAVQRVAAIFDDHLRRVTDFAMTASSGDTTKTLSAFFYADAQGRALVTLWCRDQSPGDTNLQAVDFTFPKTHFVHPVCVDMLTGRVFEIPKNKYEAAGSGCSIKSVPIYDSVVLIAERELIPLKETK